MEQHDEQAHDNTALQADVFAQDTLGTEKDDDGESVKADSDVTVDTYVEDSDSCEVLINIVSDIGKNSDVFLVCDTVGDHEDFLGEHERVFVV